MSSTDSSTIKTISATEAKTKLNAMVNATFKDNISIIIENHGQPTAVLISFSEFQKTQELKQKTARLEALERLRKTAVEVSARFDKAVVDQNQRQDISDNFSKDIIEDIAKSKKIKFERLHE